MKFLITLLFSIIVVLLGTYIQYRTSKNYGSWKECLTSNFWFYLSASLIGAMFSILT